MSVEDHRPEDVAHLTGLARFGLPQEEGALDNLTEYNTAHNKRVAMLSAMEEGGGIEGAPPQKRRITGVRFRLVKYFEISKQLKKLRSCSREKEDVINPEDIDPSVGKFRNLIQTAIIIPKSSSNAKISPSFTSPNTTDSNHAQHHILRPIKDDSFNLYAGLLDNPISSIRINSAPDVDLNLNPEEPDLASQKVSSQGQEVLPDFVGGDLQKKKYFPKEAWPGRKPTGGMAI